MAIAGTLTGRVGNDRVADSLQVVGVELVAGAVEFHKFGTRDRFRQRAAVLDREERVGGPVDDEQRRRDICLARAGTLLPREQRVVDQAERVAGALEVAIDERADGLTIELAPRAGERLAIVRRRNP